MKEEEVNVSTDDHDKLKPIDIKDIERPDTYDNQAANFNNLFDKFKDPQRELGKVAGFAREPCESDDQKPEGVQHSVDDATCQSIKKQSDTRAQDLKSHLRTCTDGELYARVTQIDHNEVMELIREVTYKGRNRNPNRFIDLKVKRPCLRHKPTRRANSTRFSRIGDTHTKKDCGRGPEKYKIDETMQTILLKIMPPELVKDMREQLLRKGSTRTIFSISNRLCSTRSSPGRWMKSRKRKVDESTSSTTMVTMTK